MHAWRRAAEALTDASDPSFQTTRRLRRCVRVTSRIGHPSSATDASCVRTRYDIASSNLCFPLRLSLCQHKARHISARLAFVVVVVCSRVWSHVCSDGGFCAC